MPRRNRIARTPQRRKSVPSRVERMLTQLADDAVNALVYMSRSRQS